MTLNEIISATTPNGTHCDQLLKRKRAEEEIVKKWQSIGPQFNLGQWVSDTEVQVNILSQRKISNVLHIKNLYIGIKNIFYILNFFFQVAISKSSNQNYDLKNFSQITISYNARGCSERTVTPYFENKYSKKNLDIVFLSNSSLDKTITEILNISDLMKAACTLSKSLRHVRLLSPDDISYFCKELWDHHCFQHCAIGFMAKRIRINKILVVGEGFPRENCLNIGYGQKIVRTNVSPSINLDRINTMYWQGDFKKMNSYKFKTKSDFLSNLPLYDKKTLSLKKFIQTSEVLNQRIILIPGNSDISTNICEKLKVYLTEHTSSHIIIKYHPARSKDNALQINDNDIVISEKSTQFGLLRHFESPTSKTFYFADASGTVFDPAPYTSVPLIVDNI